MKPHWSFCHWAPFKLFQSTFSPSYLHLIVLPCAVFCPSHLPPDIRLSLWFYNNSNISFLLCRDKWLCGPLLSSLHPLRIIKYQGGKRWVFPLLIHPKPGPPQLMVGVYMYSTWAQGLNLPASLLVCYSRLAVKPNIYFFWAERESPSFLSSVPCCFSWVEAKTSRAVCWE